MTEGSEREQIVATWVWPGNVRAVFDTLSRWLRYAFDEADWQAVQFGLTDTDADRDRWFSYALVGVPQVEVHVARNEGDEPVSIRLFAPVGALPLELRHRIEGAMHVFNSYRITDA